ncbi:MAG TPA: DUF4388 domain-containing protein [Thermoanaerobaculia bacterium]|nr:DUF4388 domain-containing protein [Thermoanaerobaculia bacterium]
MASHLSGRIESFDVVDLIQWLEVRRASGRLTLTRGADRKTIDWKNGDIVFVSGGKPGDLLGQALLRSRAVPVASLYSSLARNLASGVKLTRVLLEEDWIPRDSLAELVGALAEKLLKEVLAWKRGRFDFDPEFQTEDLLQIHLKIKGQVIAFQAMKDMDDTVRFDRSGAAEPAEGEGWEQAFRPEAVEDGFWDVLARSDDGLGAEKERELFVQFRSFAAALHARLAAPVHFFPIFDDTSRFAGEVLASEDAAAASERLLALALVDPFFAANLLILANAFAVGGVRRVGTLREAARRIGESAFRTLARSLIAGDRVPLAASDSIPRALRRGSLAAAVVASHAASRWKAGKDEAYAAGLLHAVAYADLLEAVAHAPLPAGRFRAATLEHFRPVVGRIRAEAWRAPADLADVLADAGPPREAPLLSAVRFARAALPQCAIGAIPVLGRKPPAIDAASRAEVRRLFDFLGLGEP